MSYADQKVLSIGGSRNIGYYSSIRLLEKGATVTFLLRNPSTFDNDEIVQKFVKDGKARLLKGDALVKADVAKAWEVAAKGGDDEHHVHVLLFTVGYTGAPKLSLTKGFVITPPNLVTQSLLNTLSTLPRSASAQTTKIIAVTSMGLTKRSHASLPLVLKPLYSYLLRLPHSDKVGSERLLAHCAGWEWDNASERTVSEDILPSGWQDTEGLPAPGSLKSIVIMRPALLMDGECKGDKVTAADVDGKGKGKPYRVVEEGITGYTISRKDVAHFIVEGALADWNKWEGKRLGIAY